MRRFEDSDEGIALQIPAAIRSLCVDFAFEREVGIYQIAHHLHRVMKKIKKHSVTRKMVSALAAHYLKTDDLAEVQSVVDAMVRLKYICEVQLREEKYHALFTAKMNPKHSQALYCVPIDAALQFGCK